MLSPATLSEIRNNVDIAIFIVATMLASPDVNGVLKCMLLV